MKVKSILLALTAVTASFSGSGAVITSGTEITSDGQCDTASLQITSIKTNPGGDSVSGSSYPINSTKCLGYVTDPTNDWGQSPSPNNGMLGKGLLNEELSNGNFYIPGDYFLNNPKDRMVDLDGDGDATDPGWIRLGGDDDIGNSVNVTYDSINGFNLDQVITLAFDLDGTWSLTVDPSAISLATQALERPTVFDHLAFVMKGPAANNNPNNDPNNNNDDERRGWAIYDFNFLDLIDDGLDVSLGDTAYSFEGVWDSQKIFGGQDISHFSVWAHDPPASASSVDEPALVGLFALGVAMIMMRRKKRL